MCHLKGKHIRAVVCGLASRPASSRQARPSLVLTLPCLTWREKSRDFRRLGQFQYGSVLRLWLSFPARWLPVPAPHGPRDTCQAPQGPWIPAQRWSPAEKLLHVVWVTATAWAIGEMVISMTTAQTDYFVDMFFLSIYFYLYFMTSNLPQSLLKWIRFGLHYSVSVAGAHRS